MADPHDLARFVSAQENVYSQALAEIRAGAKRSHWMWFVFPQIAGLGSSPMARTYAIASLDEARAYLAHPLLGARYRQCLEALATFPEPDAERVFGGIDALKLRSSLTLFAEAGSMEAAATLTRWFGAGDRATLDRLGTS